MPGRPRLAPPMYMHLQPRTMFHLARLAYLIVPLLVALPALLIVTLGPAGRGCDAAKGPQLVQQAPPAPGC
jgi:hypothetical protein